MFIYTLLHYSRFNYHGFWGHPPVVYIPNYFPSVLFYLIFFLEQFSILHCMVHISLTGYRLCMNDARIIVLSGFLLKAVFNFALLVVINTCLAINCRFHIWGLLNTRDPGYPETGGLWTGHTEVCCLAVLLEKGLFWSILLFCGMFIFVAQIDRVHFSIMCLVL